MLSVGENIGVQLFARTNCCFPGLTKCEGLKREGLKKILVFQKFVPSDRQHITVYMKTTHPFD